MDHESPNIEAAAYLAREEEPGDDRPSIAEIAEDASSTALRFARLAKEEGRREVIAEVVAALREQTAFYEGKVAGSEDKQRGYALGFYEAADFIEQRFAWTPTDHGYDEEAGW